MESITSLQNQTVKHIASLHKKNNRIQHSQFIAQGLSVCKTLIEKDYQPIYLLATSEAFEKHHDFLSRHSCTIVSDAIMSKISTTSTPSGLLGVFSIQKTTYKPTHNALVLYDIKDPGNLGTLIRSAAAMNIENIFLIDGVDPYNPKVIQSTAGTIAYTNIIQTTWQSFLKTHQNLTTCALVVKDGKSPSEAKLNESILVIGNESIGLCEKVIASCSKTMTIPMPGKTESLNAAVAGSIALYLKKEKNNEQQL